MPQPKPTKAQKSKKSLHTRLSDWIKRHKLDTFFIAALVVVGVIVSAPNMTGNPQRFEDEGTYVSQAWAIKEQGALTHYTYWYDHPPLGWIQMAGHLVSTGAIERYGSAITAGREFMLILHLATIVLLFALARRLGIGSSASVLGALIYTLSPLSAEFGRYVLLDNVALPWVLAAFVLALSPSKHIVPAVGSAICMAVAILSKETFIALLPVLLYVIWVFGDKRNRRYTLAAFAVIFVTISSLYGLYALLKNELIPGEGHVSLMGTLVWQIFGREGSGSILDPNSGTRGLIGYWMDIDYWLMLAGIVALPFSFIYRNLRPAALALSISVLLVLRGGYLPYPYVIILLPFAALVFAGVIHYTLIAPIKNPKLSLLKGTVARAALLAVFAAAAIFVAPTWQTKLAALRSVDKDASSREVVDWVDKNVSRDSRMVVESALWTDLEHKGFNRPDPVWLYKIDTDPEVSKEVGGWQGIDYVILNGPTLGGKDFDATFPTVSEAMKHAELLHEYGKDNEKVLVYRVNHQTNINPQPR